MTKNVFRLYSSRGGSRGYYYMTRVIDDEGNLVNDHDRNAQYGRLELHEPSCNCVEKPRHDLLCKSSRPSVFAGRSKHEWCNEYAEMYQGCYFHLWDQSGKQIRDGHAFGSLISKAEKVHLSDLGPHREILEKEMNEIIQGKRC